MQLTITSTDKITEVNGQPCRIWTGKTEHGVEVAAFISALRVENNQDLEQFERELKEVHPSAARQDIIPLRFIL